jgi:hypothetical protein
MDCRVNPGNDDADPYLFASFDGEFSSRSQSYAGKGGAKVTW